MYKRSLYQIRRRNIRWKINAMPVTIRQRVKGSTSKRKMSKRELLVTSAPSDMRNLNYPGGAMAISLLMGARLLSAYFNHIGDCDETYNYWEPLHYLVYGSGFQTWEYSPAYALRSYASLLVFAIPAKFLSFVMHPVSVFYTIRGALALASAWVELMFYKAVCLEFGVHVGRTWLFFALPAAGTYASSTAFLPSTWSSHLCTAALACWWTGSYSPAVTLIAVSVLLSWPFTALVGIPIAFDIVFLKCKMKDFFKWSAVSLLVILLPMMLVDSWYYGGLVIAPWNIVKYNVFTSHGPNLYGEEPWTYYFVNGFLNFNIVWVLTIVCPVLYAVCAYLVPQSTTRADFCSPIALSLAPLGLWLLVFMLQSHKEERFLYPVYSMILLAGAISLDCCLKMLYSVGTDLLHYSRGKRARHYLAYTSDVFAVLVVFAGVLSASRIVQGFNNYHGTMTILSQLPEKSNGVSYVCYGKDWYRSPSSFHVSEAYRLRFIESEFKGQMPAPYNETIGSRAIHPYFNDLNKGDSRTYLKPSKCHYLVDSDIGQPTAMEPAYHLDNKTWEIVASVPIIDATKSQTWFRAFYVPFLTERSVVYAKLNLLRNKLLAG